MASCLVGWYKMRLGAACFFLAFFGWASQHEKIEYVLSRLYEGAFFYCQYGYRGIEKDEDIHEWSFGRKLVCSKEAYPMMLEALEGKEQILAAGRRRRTSTVRVGEREWVVKRHLQQGFLKGVFKMGAGVTMWNNLHWAKEKGVPVIEPIGFFEKRSLGAVETVIVYPYEGEVVRKGIEGEKELVNKVDEVVDSLKKAKVIHADLRPRNMVYTKEGKIRLIDVDLMHYYPCRSCVYKVRMQKEERWFVKDFYPE